MTDKDLRQNVERALEWEPSIDAGDIGVSVDAAVVTLRGNVRSYAEKLAAERVALAVYGVKGLANDLVIHLSNLFQRTDTEIAQAAAAALNWNVLIPKERVTVTVTDGWLYLHGAVDWQYQKDAAARTVRNRTGVKGVTNGIVLKSRANPTDVRTQIEAAFKRSAEIDARRISIAATGGTVVLSGNVHSWAERQQAERAAWAAPGVVQVEDHLVIVP
jgi:osmotically-inducible protein OsmY